MTIGFAAQMLEAKRRKQEARNRGLQSGDFRGTVKPRPLAQNAGLDALEQAFADIAANLAWERREEAAQLAWLIAFNDDATMADGLVATF